MAIYNKIGTRERSGLQRLLLMLMTMLAATAVEAQIKIGGAVYGGARQANVGGSTFVNIGADHHDVIIASVYGGNDISGTIGTSEALPDKIEKATKNGIDNTNNAFVRLNPVDKDDQGKLNTHIFIGSLFGGGNGDYDYTLNSDQITYTVKDADGNTLTTTGTKPELAKTYLEIEGGTIAYVYGGGNRATVTGSTDIYINNESEVTTSMPTGATGTANYLESQSFLESMGISALGVNATRGDYHFSRVFGGNNFAVMNIQPKWHLVKGGIDNLYSGGNEGDMTYEKGLLLEIGQESEITVNNVYGGCRKADVHPKKVVNGVEQDAAKDDIHLDAYNFPRGLSARVLVRGGHINNVYGGNDIRGQVKGGSAVGIYTSISGDVYGGGNGSYPYTDNADLANTLLFGDYYYDPVKELKLTDTSFTPLQSAQALKNVRPDAEQVSIRVYGKDADNKTVIGGAIYLGGNSATLYNNDPANAILELKIGSNVIADRVFLGNNGANMVTEEVLQRYHGYVKTDGTVSDTGGDGFFKFSQMDLTKSDVFKEYMTGSAMTLMPRVVFDDEKKGDPATYDKDNPDNWSYFGSFYCGGNVGSMIFPGKVTINFDHPVIIFDKLVGGCNKAYIAKKENRNAEYWGGVIGTADPDNKDKLVFNLSGLRIEPKRWMTDSNGDYVLDENGNRQLEWNTWIDNQKNTIALSGDDAAATGTANANDLARRFKGGNIYGGCCESGVVNGNVIINLDATIMDRSVLFDEVEGADGSLYGDDLLTQQSYTITKRRTGVILGQQGMDALGRALNLFGGGKGAATEIWGSTTINMNRGYVFQVFGGSEEGVIGKSAESGGTSSGDYAFTYTPEGSTEPVTKHFSKNDDYSCYVHLRGSKAGASRAADEGNYNQNMPDCEFIYGGSFMGPIAGNAIVRLGNGRIFNSFTGSCDADILGHTETYIGSQVLLDDNYHVTDYGNGFPWVRDIVYGGNDLGGEIKDAKDFSSDVRAATTSLHSTDVLKASSYVEYRQGRADAIFGGHFGTYDYENELRYARNGTTKKLPYLRNAFVNFRPIDASELGSHESMNQNNYVGIVYGGSQGQPGYFASNTMQESSYVLVDIPQTLEYYKNTVVFGSGSWGGLGMKEKIDPIADPTAEQKKTLDAHSAIVDLVRGQMAAAYGGSYREGVTRRTVVNVPAASTIELGSIFGGAFGTSTFAPCDVYEANVNYQSADAKLVYDPNSADYYRGAVFGGNNNERRTLYGRVNISTKVAQKKVIQYDGEVDGWNAGQVMNTTATIYGAGRGEDTWSEYTEVNLEDGAEVYEVYGGGQNGKVYNAESIHHYKTNFKPANWPKENPDDESEAAKPFTDDDWAYAWNLGQYNGTTGTKYWQNSYTNLTNPLVREAEMDDRDFSAVAADDKALVQNKYNTNVIINQGAKVNNYAYAGGLGNGAVVSGSTYITLLGGEVTKDIYAGGTSGSVEDYHGVGVYSANNRSGFVATANVYVKGGTVRNVYGGGWRGSVGHHGNHNGQISDVVNNENDRDGEAHVVIGKTDGTSHPDGKPSILRNVYGGGEGGAIYGDAYVTVNKGYIGYRYKDGDYVPEVTEKKENDLDLGGNVFGGGYVANSYVDRTHVTMWDGWVRGSLYGGGEIGPVGRGTVHPDSLTQTHIASSVKHNYTGSAQPAAIYKGGETHVYMYGGHVMRDVFGGGRGYDNWNGEGWMTPEENNTFDKSSKGYVFGSTDVHIRGGEIGTEANVLRGYGNVFGGGNEGFVYSATGEKMGTRVSDDNRTNGIPNGGGGYYYYTDGDTYNGLSQDCIVDVEPYCKVTDAGGITIGENTYAEGDYVPLADLNKLKNINTDGEQWEKLDISGIVIHNALFAGGNITEGSDKLMANTVTVYGNAGASLRDVYNLDLISLGTEDMGGLYGDGNLTLVDGFREIHIDNYGTDHYSLPETLNLEDYYKLTDRQKAYYRLKYMAESDHTYTYWESKQQHTYEVTNKAYRRGEKVTQATYDTFNEEEKTFWAYGTKEYKKDDQIDEADFLLMDDAEKGNWNLYGVTSIYDGRPLNTIQRADMCGVFGSRLVLKGAVDRAPQLNGAVDYNDYTINRVDEVSLNKRESTAGDDTETDQVHGNYFGIYSSVKFLGNLTSDVFFNSDQDVRQTSTNVAGIQGDNSTTYYTWKSNNPQSKYRNNGISRNKVALASGVYLEIKREEGEATGTDKWGDITGVVELDLINVMQGMGGGYVYARNEHGEKEWHQNYGKVTLLNYNEEARTYRRFTYNQSSLQPIQTSGNFVHNTKQIVDDCYPNGGIYNDGYSQSPAHYWYIRGSIYVYDQYISAYTGAANATAERQEIPLTISAASNGRLTLRDVQPNYYAYYDKNGNKMGDEATHADNNLVVNNVTYTLNQPISYWDYRLLSEGDKAKFVEETYVVIGDCKVGDKEYKKGYVLLPTEYKALIDSNPAVTYVEDDVVKKDKDVAYFFRPSNNLSHNTGFVLTYDVNNPMVWDNYYTSITNPNQASRVNTQQWKDGKLSDNTSIDKTLYIEGPTYTLNAGTSDGVFGQQDYGKGTIVANSVVTAYDNGVKKKLSSTDDQAKMEEAYILKTDYTLKKDNGEVVQEFVAGTPVYKSKYTGEGLWDGKLSTVTERAKVCTSLLEFSVSDYVYAGQVLTSAEIEELKAKVKGKNPEWTPEQVNSYLNGYLEDAWYCTTAGKYGGLFFERGKAYRALDTWCSMSAEERKNFTFNYDALDLLIDPTYDGRLESNYGHKPMYDGTNDQKVYSSQQPIDYQAAFMGYDDDGGSNVAEITFTGKDGSKTYTTSSPWLSRTEYEAIPNEKHHYSPITVTKPDNYYVVNGAFMHGDVPYTVGQVINLETYQSLSTTEKVKVDVFEFTSSLTSEPRTETVDGVETQVYDPKTYYYCRNAYTVNEKGAGVAVTTKAIKRNSNDVSEATYGTDAEVPQGVIIDQTAYDRLKNYQKGFVIHGTSPTEVSTLYVSNESDINDLSSEKIITAIFLYEYEESDESGLNVTPVSERHIVNIHINFKSGVPEIGPLTKPDLVLPGTTIGINIPSFKEGASRATDSGWEVFSNADDAATHYNGEPFVNNETPLYWYQNGYWIAYYLKTSLGKTYSKPVQLSVGNYHDLKKVMDDKEHHYYIDHQDVGRPPKIYINDYSTDDPATSQNGLDMLKDLFTLSTKGKVEGHQPLNTLKVGSCNNLEFFMRTDIDHSRSDWEPIANDDGQCFSGILHGDGHAISGLKNSLFNHLCGQVYNLGVSGSFTGAGIAETGDGYVENCWVKTTGTPVKGEGRYAVFGNPLRSGNDLVQVVNSYYPKSNDYQEPANAEHGKATKKSDEAFYNGEVAYDLNGFYLNKRYYDGSGNTEPETSAVPKLTSGSKYVKDRYADGDFIYANGSIPTDVDERAEKDETTGEPKLDANGRYIYHPKWPDDYIFFGQALNYGHVDGLTHQDVPTAMTTTNRVYRAPAYFGNSTMNVAHFNRNAVFAKSQKDNESIVAYKGMTAIDFSGHNDLSGSASYQQGDQGGKFYPPLLDDAGITGFRNVDLTKNLLVYTDATITYTDHTQSGTVTETTVSDALAFENYESKETNSDTYHTVAEADNITPATAQITGHWVKNTTEGYRATHDHFLIDKQDFNAPIAYQFDADSRMWHQRRPENYVGRKKADGSGYIDNGAGWEGVSLPFTAEIVTTDTKGEITHFYNEGANWKGHEYWLREYKGGAMKTGSTDVFEATFNKPEAGTESKAYTNTFLWDYYYYNNGRQDQNTDKYPDESYKYYSSPRTYEKYPRLANGTPYIIGFPGERYYEFDLSGKFEARTAKTVTPKKLDPQVITFASKTGAEINVSDTELGNGRATAEGYTFVPNYSSETIADKAYVLNSDAADTDKRGSSYDVKAAVSPATTLAAVPFRPYFVAATGGGRTRSIVFTNDDSQLQAKESKATVDGTLEAYAKRKKIVVESSLRYVTDVRILNVAGITLATFTIQPGETVETRINNSGVYIVRSEDGQYTKKLSVK